MCFFVPMSLATAIDSIHQRHSLSTAHTRCPSLILSMHVHIIHGKSEQRTAIRSVENKYTNSIYAIVVLIKTKFLFNGIFFTFYGWKKPCSVCWLLVLLLLLFVECSLFLFHYLVYLISYLVRFGHPMYVQCAHIWGLNSMNRFNYFLRHIGCEKV